jgi:diacylglycerol kinase family enzyme
MNIKYIGPNLKFAPNADVEDDFLDLVLIPEAKRKAFVQYIESLINETSELRDIRNFIKILRVEKLEIKWKGSKLHVDDILVDDYDGKKIRMEMNSKTLEFFTNSPVYQEILKEKSGT